MPGSIKIFGVREVKERLGDAGEVLLDADVRRGFLAASGVIRDKERELAPKGRKLEGDKDPGLLRRSIISFLSAKRGSRQTAAWTRVNILRGRVKAPHGHWVAFGTKPRTAGGKLMSWQRNRKWISKRAVAAMPAKDYVGDAVAAVGSVAMSRAIEAIRLNINKRNK